MTTATFTITNLVCCGDAKVLEQKLKVKPHIVNAVVDFKNRTAAVTFHQEHISVTEIKEAIHACGFHCSSELPIISSKEAYATAEHKFDYLETTS